MRALPVRPSETTGRHARTRKTTAIAYRWVDHTAEVELHIEAASEEQVFLDALEAYAELVGGASAGEPARHDVRLLATDRTVLLASWLEELVFLAETENFVPEGASTLDLAENGLSAALEGRRGTPAHLVKAVTYHGLSFERDGGVWRARVVLDV